MDREKIVLSLKEEIEKISIENGFYTDKLKVYEWLFRPLGREESPACIIRDTKDEVIEGGGLLEHHLTFEIDLVVVGESQSVKIRDLISDTLRAVGAFEQKTNLSTLYKSSEISIEHKESIYALSLVEFEVVYFTNRWEQ